MRASLTWWTLLGSVWVAGGLACSSNDDKQTGTGELQGSAGAAPMAPAPAGTAQPAMPPAAVPVTPVRGPGENGVPAAGGLDQGQQNTGSAARDAGADAAVSDAGGGSAVRDAGRTPPPPADAGGAVRFADVLPILIADCGSCHGTGRGNLPQFAVANEAAAFTATQGMSADRNGNRGVVSTRIIARAVTARTMPPSCGGGALGTGTCLSVADAAQLQAWVNQGANP
jgi:hypothetical protein